MPLFACRPRRGLPLVASALSAVMVGCLAGCGGQPQIVSYNVPKSPDEKRAHPAPVAPRAPAAASVETVPVWKVPDGWQELPGNALRYATLVIDPRADTPLEIAVSKLPWSGDTQEARARFVFANINRWFGQMGLPPADAESLKKTVSTIATRDTEALLIDLLGTYSPGMQAPPEPATKPATGATDRMLSAMLPVPDGVWFFKLIGPRDAVSAAEPAYRAFVSQVTFRTVGDHPSTPLRPPQAQPQVDVKYTLPKEWTAEARPAGAMASRRATFAARDGERSVEIAIQEFPTATGTLLDNVTRWRGQMGLGPATQEEVDRIAKSLAIGPLSGQYVVIVTPPETKPGKATLAVTVEAAGRFWFVTLKGDAELAERERPRFEAFAQSLIFTPPGGENHGQ